MAYTKTTRLILASILLTPLLAQAASTVAISTSTSGAMGNDASNSPRANYDGTYIVYDTSASNISSFNGQQQILRSELNTTNSILVSRSANGNSGDQYSFGADISDDGNAVAFSSYASNLTADNVNTHSNVFLRNISNNNTILVSYAINNEVPNGISDQASISGDGEWIAFVTMATNIAPLATNGQSNIYLRHISSGASYLVTKDANAGSITPSVSFDGRYVAFASAATNLTSDNDNNGAYDIFVFDRSTQSIQMVSKNDMGIIGDKKSSLPDISRDGRFISFHSFSTNLDVDFTTRSFNVFLRDINYQTTRVVSRTTDKLLANSISLNSRISSNGRFISFITRATNLATPDNNPGYDLVVYDRILNEFEILNRNNAGIQTDSTISFISDISGNGEIGVFASGSPNLGANNIVNIFARVRDPIANIPPVAVAGPNQNIMCTGSTTNVFLDGSSSYDDDGHIIDFTWSDENSSFSGSQTSVSLVPGVYEFSLTVTDDQKATATNLSIINVIDDEAPTIPLSTIQLEASSPLGSPYSFNLVANDNCSEPSLSILNTRDHYPLGISEVVLTATDSSNNSHTVAQPIYVVDTTKPVFDNLVDVVIEATGTLTAIALNAPGAIDFFLEEVFSDAPTSLGLGDHFITWTAVDSSKNSAQATQKVSIVDTTAPALELGPTVTLEASSVNGATHTITPVSASDSCQCGQLELSFDPQMNVYPLGDTTVTATLTDQSGNSTTDTLLIKVIDSTAPVLLVPADITVEANGVDSNVTLTQAIADDLFSVEISSNAPSVFPIGTTEVIWTATDASKNVSTGVQRITVVDTTAPVFKPIADVSLEANAVLSAYELQAPSVDDIFGVTLSNNAPAGFPLGNTTVTWIAVDKNGNSSTATQVITVVDTTVPNLLAPQNITIEATAMLSEVSYGFASATDIFSTSITHNAPILFPVGTTPIVWTALDANGNTSSTTQLVTVVDTTAPSFTFDLLKDELWPPRFRMIHAATVTNIKDLVDAAPVVEITVTTQDDQKRLQRHKLKRPDWEIKQVGGDWEIWLRARKLIRSREDRIFSIEVAASDIYGNTQQQTAEVIVPHSKGHHGHKHVKDGKHRDGETKHKHRHAQKKDDKKDKHSRFESKHKNDKKHS